MTDFTPEPQDTTPDLGAQVAALVTRHGLTALSGILVEHGLLAHDQQTQFISVGASILTAALALGWSYVQKHTSKSAIVAATGAKVP